MTARMSDARRAAFLKALEACGNQSLAAGRACVSLSWVCQERMRNPDFDAACKRTIASARNRLRQAKGNRPPQGWGHLDGVELVVRGTKGRRVQIARARAGQWTAASEDRFLEVFAATCNAKAAYEAAGKSKGSAYTHRKRWPGFARRWGAAEETGYARVEMALLENGCNLFSSTDLPPECPMPAMSVDQALQLLRLHRSQMRAEGRAPGRRPRTRTFDEVRPAIARKIEIIRRGRGAG